MAKTLYEEKNATFSDSAHMEARKQIYPKIFTNPNVTIAYENIKLIGDERQRILDGEMAVDRIIKVKTPTFRFPIKITVQERFRRKEYSGYKDMTVTELNNESGMPSELYKMNAGIFLYGYYDDKRKEFLDAIAVNTTDLLYKVLNDEIPYTRFRNKKSQDFLAFKFSDMEEAGVVIYRHGTQLRKDLLQSKTGCLEHAIRF